MLPLLVRVTGWEGYRTLASNIPIHKVSPCFALLRVKVLIDNIDVPDPNNEVPKLIVLLQLSVGDLMILYEIIKCDDFLITEALVRLMQRGEETVELKFSLFGRLNFREHIRMSRGIIFGLNFF